MARCRPCSILLSLNPPDQIDRGANNTWAVPDVLYNPQAFNNFLPGSRKVWEPPPSSAAVPEARDLLQQCLWAAGITEQLLEAEARREPLPFQPSAPSRSAPQTFPGGAPGQPPLLQPWLPHLGGQPGPQVVLLQQVPQRIILQVKQPGPTTLALLPSPASCVLGSAQGPGPPAHKATGHPSCATPSPCGHQPPGAAAAAPQPSSTPKAVGIQLWHGESFWGLEPKWGQLVDSFVSYF